MKKFFLTLFLLTFLASGAQTQWTLEGETFKVDTLRHEKVGPGTFYTNLYLKSQTTQTHMRVHFLTMDMKGHDNVEYRMELGNDSLLTVERISDVAKRKTEPGNYYFAGINADFYITWNPYIGTPNMACYTDGQIAMTDIDEATKYGHFFMDYEKNMWCDYPYQSWTMTKKDGTKIALSRINYDLNDNELVLYNEKGGNFTKTKNAREIRVKLVEGEKWRINAPFKMQVIGKAVDGGNMQVLPGEGVLSAKGSRIADIDALKDGEILTMYFETKLGDYNITPPNLKEASGGDVVILHRGNIIYEAGRFINPRDAFNPRSMFGYPKDKSKMIWGLIDGRSVKSSGSTYPQGAAIMKYAGCFDAVNVDGGGSSGMYIQNLGIVNDPSDGKERAVSNGLYAVLKAPEDNNIAEIRFVDWAMKFPKYGVYTPVFYGYNQYGMLIDTDVKGVTLSCDPAIGEIINDGTTFYGKGDGSGALKASFNGLEASIPVVVADNDQVSFRLSDVVIDNLREYPVEVQALVNEKQMPMNPSALNWASANPEIATVGADNGVLCGVANGKTTVSGTVGAFSGSLNVTVEIPESPVMPIVKDIVADEWTLKQTGGKGIAISGLDNGFSLGYTGNGAARGAYISADRTCQIWSLPTKLQVRINPGEAIVKRVSANISNALGEKVTSWTITDSELPKNEESVLAVNLSDNFNLEDIGIFPISVNSLRLDMGKSDKDKNYQIAVPGFEAVYEAGGAVETIETDALRIYPNPVVAGQPFSVEAEGNAVVQVFSLSGAKLMETPVCGRSLIPTADMAPGIYIIKASAENNSKTSKLIVR